MMNIRNVTTTCSLLFTLLSASALLAQQDYPTGQEQGAKESASGSGSQSAETSSDSKSGIKVAELKDKVLINEKGEKIANVSDIVRGKDDDRLQAVVEVSGYYGMSRQEIVLPLNELEIKGGQFVAPDAVSTEEQLKTRPEYDAAEYEAQSDDQQIERSEFAAFESGDVSDQPGRPGATGQGQDATMSQ